ncbi:MAG TPA: hypothetical protein VFS21_30245 [Roseiflexaceae bacterium]|nr:hypothetical protein [Roseiflexaceae bacterium]
MAYTLLPSIIPGDIVTAAYLNTIRDDLRDLKGYDGPIRFLDSLQVYVASTDPNATGALFLGHSGNKAAAAAWGQRNGSNNGGRFIILTRTDADALAEAVRIDQLQRTGLGTDNPMMRLHVRDGGSGGTNYGNAGFWSAANIGGTAVTIIPAGSGVTTVRYDAITISSNGSLSDELRTNQRLSTIGSSPSTTLNLFNNAGTDILNINLSSGGVFISRVGSLTYRVMLQMMWF